jgi:hypothetical protein
MGAGFSAKLRNYDCGGQQVTNKLDQVFRNPGPSGNPNPKFKFAKDHNNFDKVPVNKKDNWKDLLIAYLKAGVDVGNELPAWVSYLEDLGAGEDGDPGPQQISLIAGIRYNALITNTGIETKTHRSGHVETPPGVIDSPCPL